jgi:hypothetical protein
LVSWRDEWRGRGVFCCTVALSFTLDQQSYEALIALAADGTKLPDGTVDTEKARRLDEFLRSIEKKAGITRSVVWVQWQEQDSPLPPGTKFPDKWPPELRKKIELISRAVARADVDKLLQINARQPTNVLCTKDPAGVLGYTPVDDFFVA